MRRFLLQVILRDKAGQHLRLAHRFRQFGVIAAVAQVASFANKKHLHTGLRTVGETGDYIHVAVVTGYVLLLHHLLQHANLVTILRRLFKIQRLRGGFHLCHQVFNQARTFALQKQQRMLNVSAVIGFTDIAHTRCGAAFNLVLQTGARAVLEIAVFALANLEQLVNKLQAVTHRTGTGKWPQVLSLFAAAATVHHNLRIGIVNRGVYKGVGFVVAQQNIVAGLVRLDQVRLQQQRFTFGVGNGDIDVMNLFNQCAGFNRQPGFSEVTGNAFFKIFGLAHIQQILLGIVHTIDTGMAGQVFQKRIGVKIGGTGGTGCS